jgi:dolichol-phosphate mannosyltransferase
MAQLNREPRLLSVVAPMYDEEGTVDVFYDRMRTALDGLPFELVLVDDASHDRTPALLDRLADSDPRVRVLHLSRNFGHQAAMTAGLEHAGGDVVAMIDGDLQDPPELIPTMLDRWRRGSDVVYGVRENRAGESRFKLATARWFYRLFGRVTGLDLQENSGDFRLLDRRALDAVLAMRERNRFLRGMTVWVGFTQTAVPYSRDARHAGETKYTLRRMLRFSLDAISSFSWLPLQAATLLGFVFSIVAFLGLPLVIVARIAGMYVPGISSILFVILLLGGIQLITVGIIGEYVGRIYDEVKGRPLYVVREGRNIGGDEAPDEAPPEPQRVSTT